MLLTLGNSSSVNLISQSTHCYLKHFLAALTLQAGSAQLVVFPPLCFEPMALSISSIMGGSDFCIFQTEMHPFGSVLSLSHQLVNLMLHWIIIVLYIVLVCHASQCVFNIYIIITICRIFFFPSPDLMLYNVNNPQWMTPTLLSAS